MVCDAVRPQPPQLWVQVDVMLCYKPELLANDILSKANAQYGIVHGGAANLQKYAFPL